MITFIVFLLGLGVGYGVTLYVRAVKGRKQSRIEDTKLEHKIMRLWIEQDIKGGLECLDKLLETVREYIPDENRAI